MKIKVPFFSMESAPSELKNEWLQAISKVVESGRFINGSHLSEFEENWATYVGTKAAVGVGNGLDGLAIALKAIGIQPGDRVAVPAHTFIASWTAIHNVGAIPVGVDIDKHGLMDLSELEKLKGSIKAVMPVHMHGAMLDMKSLMAMATLNNWLVIEDASQAHGAAQEGIKAGAWGDIGVFSLYPTKNLGAIGDAGVVVTNNKEVAEVVRSMGNYGSSKENKYKHELIGGNSRLDEIQAAVLNVNLKYLDFWNSRRVTIANKYSEALAELNILHIELQNKILNSVRHHFPVVVPDRQELISQLAALDIQTEIHYPFSAAYEFEAMIGRRSKIYPCAEKLSQQILSLPMSPWMSEDQISAVITGLNKCLIGQ